MTPHRRAVHLSKPEYSIENAVHQPLRQALPNWLLTGSELTSRLFPEADLPQVCPNAICCALPSVMLSSITPDGFDAARFFGLRMMLIVPVTFSSLFNIKHPTCGTPRT